MLFRSLHATIVEGRSGEINAFVELQKGRTATAADIEAQVTGQLPPDLVPSRTVILENMPRTFSGKANRAGLSAGIGN